MSLINIQALTFAYDGSYDNIFENVSFQIDTAWRLGFTGRNGRGKTTFLNLLLGKHEYSGTITKSVELEYFPFEVNEPEALTLDVIHAAGCDCLEWQIIRELKLLALHESVLYRPFGTLSNGEQTKIMLAALFLKENSFLLIDEPTNHLDIHGRQLVSDYLKAKSGFILVSHDRAFLDNCIDHILSINKTDIEVQRGNYSSWQENRERQDNFELTQNERLKKDITRLDEAAKRSAKWSSTLEKTKYAKSNGGTKPPDRGYIGAQAAKMMKHSKVTQARRESARAEKALLLKNLESAEELKLAPLIHHSKTLFSASNLTISYGETTACSNVSFTFEKGDRLALCGANGSGKSSILKLICGEKINYTGEIYMPAELIISYVSQSTAHLSGNLSEFALKRNIDESLFKAILRKLDFERVQFEKNIEDYSGGQKKKVLIAASLCDKAHLLVWDEPLNFIDVISRIQIEKLLISNKPTIIFVEHDSTFCNKISTKKFELI